MAKKPINRVYSKRFLRISGRKFKYAKKCPAWREWYVQAGQFFMRYYIAVRHGKNYIPTSLREQNT